MAVSTVNGDRISQNTWYCHRTTVRQGRVWHLGEGWARLFGRIEATETFTNWSNFYFFDRCLFWVLFVQPGVWTLCLCSECCCGYHFHTFCYIDLVTNEAFCSACQKCQKWMLLCLRTSTLKYILTCLFSDWAVVQLSDKLGFDRINCDVSVQCVPLHAFIPRIILYIVNKRGN